MSEREKCSSCEKEFTVMEFPMGVPGGKEKQPIICPYCGHTEREAMIDGWFSTSEIK